MKRWLASLVLLSVAFSAFADGFIVVDEAHWHPRPPEWPGWRPPIPPAPRPYVFAPLEVTYHHVNVQIDGQIATTTVDEEFYNPNPQRLEGTYLFPVPKGAQINKFTMDIGGKQVEAELLSADKARSIYEDIVRKLKDPALLEYADRDVFKVRIFPIEPRAGKRITISYSQVLKSDSGLVSYVYPLNTEKFSAKPIKDVSLKIELSAAHALKTIYSPSHNVEIRHHGANKATVGFESKDVKPDTDFELFFAEQDDDLGVKFMPYKEGSEDGYFLLLVSPGTDIKDKKTVPKDVAFVLDTSGSMAGKKLEQARKALQFCIENLNEGDRFEIIRFSTEVEPLFDKLVDATKSNREKAGDFIKDLKPIGGTAIDEALKKALSLRNTSRRDELHESQTSGDESKARDSYNSSLRESGRPYVVIFLTDGQPTVGTTDMEQILSNLKRRNEGRTRVFCFGIGADVNTHLLDKITEETRAVSQYVLPEEDLEVKVSSFFSKIKEPVLANPTLKFTGDVRATKMYPSPLPDLFRGDQLALVGRYSGKGDSAVVLEGTVNGVTRRIAYDVRFPRETTEHEFIPRLWATRRVGYLLDEIRLHGENPELRDEVTDLARKYGIVTPYTAYLIVEDETRRGVPVARQSLPQLYSDRAARKDATLNWDSFKGEVAGEKALAGARYGYELKNATAPALATASGAVEANRALDIGGLPRTAALSDNSKVRLAQYSQQGQFIAGKNFFQNDKQWVDAAAQKFQSAKRQRIQFNSTEYFAFAAKNSKALPYLALGQNVQFVLDDTLYEIYE
jgi:Ca-activated chloride channel homolog